MAKQRGLFPEQPGGGVQGLFDPGRRATPPTGATTPVLPGSSTQPSLPGSSPAGGSPEPKRTREPKPKRRKRILRRLSFVHVAIAVAALIGIARSNSHTHIDLHVPSVTTPAAPRVRASETPAFKTMAITASGRATANGVYRATPTAIDGASTHTYLEFALAGRGSRQHVVYVAGLHVRDASCDHEPRTDPTAGLLLYDDELTGHVRGRSITAATKDHETLTATATSAGDITGTFRFHHYTGCPSGGHLTFRATRDPTDTPLLAKTIWGIAG